MKRNKKTEDELRIVADPQVINGIIEFISLLRRKGLFVTAIEGGTGITYPVPYKVRSMKRKNSRFTKNWIKKGRKWNLGIIPTMQLFEPEQNGKESD